jgi:Domain of unknown function (DUF4411)
MISLFDTSSFDLLAKCYHPFDQIEFVLRDFFIDGCRQNQIATSDKVLEECQRLKKGSMIEALAFLMDKSICTPIASSSLQSTLSKKISNLINNQFLNKDVVRLRSMTETELETEKQVFKGSTDFNLILAAYGFLTEGKRVCIVTEESNTENDGKIFKKIPNLCKSLGIETMTLPQWLLTQNLTCDFSFNP